MKLIEILENIRKNEGGNISFTRGAITYDMDNLIKVLRECALWRKESGIEYETEPEYWYDGECIGTYGRCRLKNSPPVYRKVASVYKPLLYPPKRSPAACAKLAAIRAQAEVLSSQLGYWDDLIYFQGGESIYKAERIAEKQKNEAIAHEIRDFARET